MKHTTQHCYLCGDDVAIPHTGTGLDHVVPRSRGGGDGANLKPCCAPCNSLKARWSLRKFYERCENVVYALFPGRHTDPERLLRYERILDHLDGFLDECPIYDPPTRDPDYLEGMPACEWLKRSGSHRKESQRRLKFVLKGLAISAA